jgi:hypothetical protein
MMKRILIWLLVLISIFAILNFPATTKQGVNYELRILKIPLYIKIIEYVDRDYHYRVLTKGITANCRTEEEKVIAIFDWVAKNIHKVPEGFDVVDDHILNIIIRRYGTANQAQDVFTALSAYAGFPSFWEDIFDKDRKAHYPLSFVKLKGSWRVFDAYYGKYFRTTSGAIASIDDILNDKSLVSGDDIDKLSYRGVPYEEFYYNLKPIGKLGTLRPEKQMLLKRVLFEAKKMLGIEVERPCDEKI